MAKLKRTDGSKSKLKTFVTANSPADYQIDWSNIGLKSNDMILNSAFFNHISTSIRIINISANKLQYTPAFIKGLKNKAAFDISNNKLRYVSSSDGLQEFYRDPTSKIYLFNNPIERIWLKNEYRFQLEKQIDPKHLISVEVHNYPGLKKLPDYICNKTKNLETLVLKGIHLGTRVKVTNETSIDERAKAKLLGSHTQQALTYTIHFGHFLQQDRLCHLKQLKLLDLSSNGIGELPTCLKTLTNLHTLHLQINTFPITKYCNGTKRLESYNTSFLKTILSIPGLQYLDLSINELGKQKLEMENRTLQKYLPRLTSLKHLKMDYNYLGRVTLPDISTLKKLNSFKIYPMYNGNFGQLPQSIYQLNFTVKNNCKIGPAGRNLSCYKNNKLKCVTKAEDESDVRWRDPINDAQCSINSSFYKATLENYGTR